MSGRPWIVALALIASCGKAEPEGQQVAPLAVPAPPPVGDAAGSFVLRYFAPASGQLVQVKAATEVPQGARGQVLVTFDDPALQGPWLYVADLSQKQGDHYAVRSVDRQELEKQVATSQAKPAVVPAAAGGEAGAVAAAAAAPAVAAAAPKGDVVIFRTAWCGYCKKAAEYLRLKGVAYVEKDLERDAGAREDMMARAKQAGVGPDRLQGVPILSVRGKIINGFDRNAIDRALAGG